jgi:MoaA/NifB/PqqE/SkfB family radical SAM enzyme
MSNIKQWIRENQKGNSDLGDYLNEIHHRTGPIHAALTTNGERITNLINVKMTKAGVKRIS